MIRNLLTSFFVHHSLVTTQKRARAVIIMIDRLINAVNENTTLNAIRYAKQWLFTEVSSRALFEKSARYKGVKTSGFCTITPVKLREGDCAKLVRIELE